MKRPVKLTAAQKKVIAAVVSLYKKIGAAVAFDYGIEAKMRPGPTACTLKALARMGLVRELKGGRYSPTAAGKHMATVS